MRTIEAWGKHLATMKAALPSAALVALIGALIGASAGCGSAPETSAQPAEAVASALGTIRQVSFLVNAPETLCGFDFRARYSTADGAFVGSGTNVQCTGDFLVNDNDRGTLYFLAGSFSKPPPYQATCTFQENAGRTLTASAITTEFSEAGGPPPMCDEIPNSAIVIGVGIHSSLAPSPAPPPPCPTGYTQTAAGRCSRSYVVNAIQGFGAACEGEGLASSRTMRIPVDSIGFDWNDEGAAAGFSTVTKVEVSLVEGMRCLVYPPDYEPSAMVSTHLSLNGSAVGSLDWPLLAQCSCLDPGNPVTTALGSVNSYAIGGKNSFRMDATGLPAYFGLDANPAWGAGAFAKVVVTY